VSEGVVFGYCILAILLNRFVYFCDLFISTLRWRNEVFVVLCVAASGTCLLS
jgi:hypothetical protein